MPEIVRPVKNNTPADHQCRLGEFNNVPIGTIVACDCGRLYKRVNNTYRKWGDLTFWDKIKHALITPHPVEDDE